MDASLFSTYWYRVAKLKPALRESVMIARHVYRGQPWYVLRNGLSVRHHRYNAAAYALISQMDGYKTIQEIWDNAGRLSTDAIPTQDEFIRLLAQLHEANLIQSDILPSTAEMVHQIRAGNSPGWKQARSNPFAVRIPLVDPERFLQRWHFLVSPLFTQGAFLLWLVIVLSAAIQAGVHWPELTGNMSERILSTQNLLLIWLMYPLVKLVHELGHAFAVKKWGGEVHEMGITLLALTPIPYVDASSSAVFPEKRRRIAVAATGMALELLLAGLALFVWLNAEPGLIRSIAYNLMLIGGVSTVLFNGNPLLRYDGYYILADLLEIPNLAERASRYYGYLLRRYMIGIDAVESPVTAPGEERWFLLYHPLAFIYRIIVVIGLVVLISGRYFLAGVVLALWGGITLLFLPALRSFRRFLASVSTEARRKRFVGMATGLSFIACLLIVVFPAPLWTSTQGVIWLPEKSTVRAGSDSEIVELSASPGQRVVKGTPLVRGVDPFIQAQVEIYKARLAELYATYNAQPLNKRVERNMILEEIEQVKGDLQQAEETAEKLVIRSPAAGNFVLLDAAHIQGRFVKQGELLGYVIGEHRPTVRAVVGQGDIGLVRERVTAVEVRLAERQAITVPGRIERLVPAADINLPSAALGTSYGGPVPVDPTDPKGLRALSTTFQVDISLPEQVKTPYIGSRAYVKVSHGSMSLFMQWYRSLKQLFLKGLDI